jgi:hypothetical protein
MNDLQNAFAKFGSELGGVFSNRGVYFDVVNALISLDGVRDAIVEGSSDRMIVGGGHVRITVHGGFADEIADTLNNVLPMTVLTDGFTEAESSTGIWYWFDHVDPCVRYPRAKPWYRRLWDWLRGR